MIAETSLQNFSPDYAREHQRETELLSARLDPNEHCPAHPSTPSMEVSFKAWNSAKSSQIHSSLPYLPLLFIFFWWIKDDLCCAGEQWAYLKNRLIHTRTLQDPAEKTAASQEEISVSAVWVTDIMRDSCAGVNSGRWRYMEVMSMVIRAVEVMFVRNMSTYLKAFTLASFKYSLVW